jgi:VanZ family protein
MSLHRSTAWPLAWACVALITYATLHPLTGWRWPEAENFSWVLPKQRFEGVNDVVSNLLGYMPLGLMLCLAWLRSGRALWWAALMTVAMGSVLSYLLELGQYTLPARVPSISDWMLNTLGMAWGMLAAITAQALGLLGWWDRWRERWFIPQAGFGLALMWLWPLGLLFPPPLPLALGQIWPTLYGLLIDWTANTPMQAWVLPEGDALGALIDARWPEFAAHQWVADQQSAWQPSRDTLIVALGLLAPMCLACAVARPPAMRLVLLVGAVGIATLGTTLSTAVNYGPEHALTWLSLTTMLGMLIGALAGGLLLGRTRSTAALIGLVVLATQVWLVHQVPPDPYYAQTLLAWEHGRFVRFHGLARWFGMLWPYAAIAWLLGRVLGRKG